jgi:hypothetical protein
MQKNSALLEIKIFLFENLEKKSFGTVFAHFS